MLRKLTRLVQTECTNLTYSYLNLPVHLCTFTVYNLVRRVTSRSQSEVRAGAVPNTFLLGDARACNTIRARGGAVRGRLHAPRLIAPLLSATRHRRSAPPLLGARRRQQLQTWPRQTANNNGDSCLL